jgi:ubiquitin carboxyl-terminal hydrolase 36/42
MPLYGGESPVAKHRQDEKKHEKKWSGSWTQKKNKLLDEALRSNKKAAFHTIKFVSAKKRENGSIDASNTDPDFSSSPHETKKTSGNASSGQDDDTFEVVDHPLYPQTRIKRIMSWNLVRKIGPGLINTGNTCFCNSVLQCLTYTPPLANFCLQKEHTKRCHKSNVALANGVFDAFAALEQHIQNAFTSSKTAIRPSGNNFCRFEPDCMAAGITKGDCMAAGITSCLRKIGSHFRQGRQEDAHEFARLLMESMHTADLRAARVSVSPYSRIAQTGVVHGMFGGHLRSQVLLTPDSLGNKL